MTTIDISKPRRRIALKALLLTAGLASGTASLAHSELENFEMTVVTDAAFGHKVMDGELDAAIKSIEASHSRPSSEFFAQNNLCVAYTKSGQFSDAEMACDAAISKTLSGRQLKLAENGPAERRYAAIALSNRGVLHALMGDEGRAAADFTAAVKLRARLGAPKRNLEFLQARADGAVTMLQTDH